MTSAQRAARNEREARKEVSLACQGELVLRDSSDQTTITRWCCSRRRQEPPRLLSNGWFGFLLRDSSEQTTIAGGCCGLPRARARQRKKEKCFSE
jgi:hypothetical protein